MHSIIEHFLVNIFVITFFLFMAYIFVFNKEKDKKSKGYGIIVFTIITIFLCMLFPTENLDGFFFDLRGIPIILASLYGGYLVAIPLIMATIFFQYLLNGSGLILSMELSLLLLVFPAFSSLFKSLSVKRKCIITNSFSFIFSLSSVILTSHSIQKPINFKISAIFILFEMIGMIFVFNTIELFRKNKRLKTELVKKEKLTVVSELAASISHEIRNPLTVTRGFIQMLDDPQLDPQKRKNYIDLSLSELDKANSIITDYLSFAKPAFEKIEVIDVNDEIKKIGEIISPYANMKNVNIEVNLGAKFLVKGEIHKFHQIILNIAKNGIEAIIDGGELSIITKISSPFKGKIIIVDNGIGMDKQQLQKMGEPYFSTKESGTGLGMMVVFSIIDIMRGKIDIVSEKGKGTRVTITLPIVNQTEE